VHKTFINFLYYIFYSFLTQKKLKKRKKKDLEVQSESLNQIEVIKFGEVASAPPVFPATLKLPTKV
jgi:hypothetical protein